MIFAWIYFTVMLVGLSVAVVTLSFNLSDSINADANRE